MLREINLDEISDGKLYSSNDMPGLTAKAVTVAPPAVTVWEVPSSLIHWMCTGFPSICQNQ